MMRRCLQLLVWCLIALSTPTVHCTLGPLREMIFPKNPVITKIRDLSEARANGDPIILHFIALVERHGYPAEEHNITTEDGYHITLHRIPSSPLLSSSSNNKPVVYIQHGLMGSSDSWVLMGPQKDLAFLLADAGYDVWLGNIRGNTYCRSHETLTTADPEFWKFSFDEMALKDIPAAVDYILKLTGRKTLQYIGHSLGTAMIYILLSTIPEYNKKFSLAITWAPVAYWNHEFRRMVGQLLEIGPEFQKILESEGVYDLAPQTTMNAVIGKTFCRDGALTQSACRWAFSEISGMDSEQLNTTLLPYFLKYMPAGASTQTVFHLRQTIVTHRFAKYDYGSAEENFKHYNQAKPPAYQVEKITAPMAVVYAPNDAMIKKEDVLELYKRLRSVVYFEEVPYKKFGHLDYMWAINAKEILYDRTIALLNKYKD